MIHLFPNFVAVSLPSLIRRLASRRRRLGPTPHPSPDESVAAGCAGRHYRPRLTHVALGRRSWRLA